MTDSVNKIIQDKMIGHQVGLLRLSSGITKKLVTLLNKTEDDLVSQLSRLEDDRLSTVLKDTRQILDAAKSGEYDMLKKELTDLAEYEPKYVEQVIKGALPMKFNMTAPSTDMLSSIVTTQPFQGKLLKEWVEDLSDSRRKLVRDAVRMGMVEGQTIDQIARRIRGTRVNQYKDGLMETSRRGAQAMVRTAVNHTASSARQEMFKKNSEIVGKEQYIATLDSRTTPLCQSLDGRVYPVGEAPVPGRDTHIGCRSALVPVVKSFRELGFDIDEAPPSTRASMDGQVPEKTTYNDWLKGQSTEMQDSILGPNRAEMFRNGVSVDKFVDINTGRHFTLKELGEMDGVKVPVNQIEKTSIDLPYAVGKEAIKGKEKFTLNKILSEIDANTEAKIELQTYREKLKNESDVGLFVKKKVALSQLKGFRDIDVIPELAKPGKGAIVVGKDGIIYDGRHRAALAFKNGQTEIEALVPVLKVPVSEVVPQVGKKRFLEKFPRDLTIPDLSKKNEIFKILESNPHRDSVLPDGGSVFADNWLEQISRIQKMDGLPSIVDEDTFNAIDGDLLFRGVGQIEFKESFATGEYFGGSGVYGNGYYFAGGTEATAYNEASAYALGKVENITTAKINKDAKIINSEQLKKEMEEWQQIINKKFSFREISAKVEAGELTESEADTLLTFKTSFASDPGRFAALKGYDGIRVRRTGELNYVVIINRSILTVLK